MCSRLSPLASLLSVPGLIYSENGIQLHRQVQNGLHFPIFRILVWLQVCARHEGCWEGLLEEGGGAE